MIVADVDDSKSIKEVVAIVLEKLPKPFHADYDTVKIYFLPHHFKSQNLVINMQDDDTLLLKNDSIVKDHLVDQCEVSVFNYKQYIDYKKDPTIKW